MTINKAIEILRDLTTTLPQFSPDDRREAVLLGIEALEQVKGLRYHFGLSRMPILKGETSEATQVVK